MENRIIFREMLSEIKEKADARGGMITKEEVRKQLSELPLEEEHIQMVFDYLKEQRIRVADTEDEAAEFPEDEEQRSLSLYVQEMLQLEKEISGDEQELIHRLMNGDRSARDPFIQRYLPVICEMADECKSEELPVEDLIQEGNLGLLMALEAVSDFERPAAFRAHILNSVSQAMQNAVNSSRDRQHSDQGIVSRANHLKEAVNELEQELGHKVSPEELSAYLDMPLEEIRDVLRMSGDQIETEENSGE